MSNVDEVEKQLIQEGADLVGSVEEKLHLKKKKPFYRRGWFWVLFIFFVILIILAIGYLKYWLPFRSILSESQRAQSHFISAQQQLLAADFRSASVSLDKAYQSLQRLENSIENLGVAARIGPMEKQYQALLAMTLAGQNMSTGLRLATDISSEVLAPLENATGRSIADVSVEEKRDILQTLYEAAPDIQGAKAEVELAQAQLEQVDTDGLHPLISKYLSEMKEKLSEVHIALSRSSAMAQVLPTLLGYPGDRTYLFLLQNQHEMRATGGFIGTVGVLKAQDADIASFETSNVYDLDINAEGIIYAEPPEPISEYMNVDGWYLRDSNWSPDFEIASTKAREFFALESALPGSPFAPQRFDGVIAITPTVIEDFLELVGAVEVKNFVFNSDNFTERLEYLVEVGYKEVGDEFSTRKNIIGALSTELFDRFEKMPLNDWMDLVDILQTNLKEKQILLWIKDPVVQEKIADENWAGKVRQTPVDYLMFVDSNLAALKTDQYMKKDIQYQLKDLGDKIVAKATINYENTGTFTWKSTRYRTYTRLYVPKGSKWIKTEGSMAGDRTSTPGETDIYTDLNKTVFGAFISIEPGTKGSLSFEYELPQYVIDIVRDGHYSLLVQKQAGTIDHGLGLTLGFEEKITSALPGEAKSEWGDKTYAVSTDLREDKEFRVNF